MELYQHQKQALQETEGLNHVAYYLDMGLGKTFIGAEKALSMDCRQVLVICQKSKIQDWIDHFGENYEPIAIHDLTKRKESATLFSQAKVTGHPLVGIIN